MASTHASHMAPALAIAGSQAVLWAEGLGKVFKRVALFEVESTTASVGAVFGMSADAMGRQLSLIEQTPLRWAVEAASPIIGAGRSPGGPELAALLGVEAPRAYAVLPIVVRRKLVALAYADQHNDPLPLASASELFAYCDTLLEGSNPQQEALKSTAAVVAAPPKPAFRSTARRDAPRQRLPQVTVDRRITFLLEAAPQSPPSPEPWAAASTPSADPMAPSQALSSPATPWRNPKNVLPSLELPEISEAVALGLSAPRAQPPAPKQPEAPTAAAPPAAALATPAAKPPPADANDFLAAASSEGDSLHRLFTPAEGDFDAAKAKTAAQPIDEQDEQQESGWDEHAFALALSVAVEPADEYYPSYEHEHAPEASCFAEATDSEVFFADTDIEALGDDDFRAIEEPTNDAPSTPTPSSAAYPTHNIFVDTLAPPAPVHEFGLPANAASLPQGLQIGADLSPSGAADRVPLLQEFFTEVEPTHTALATADSWSAGKLGVVTPSGVLSLTELRRRPPPSRRWLARAPVAVGVAALALTAIAVFTLSPMMHDVESTEVSLTIPFDANVPAIARLLKEKQLVRNGQAFQLLTRLTGKDRHLKAGSYKLTSNAWAWQVLAELNRGQVQTISVTLPEGLSFAEVAQLLEKHGMGSAQEITSIGTDHKLLAKYGIGAPSIEGYIFPETYTFARGLQPRDVVEEMVQHFFRQIATIPGALDLAPDALLDRVILASIVQREARHAQEMPRIAGVFANRLQRDMRLESCATVQYVLGKQKERLTLDDVRVSSPYNTYLKTGLPPGPIANPGFAALHAAFAPEEHDYLFFVAKEDGSHSHIFTKDYDTHKAAQQSLRRK